MRYCFSFAPQKIGSFQHTKDTKKNTNASPSVDTTNYGKKTCSADMSRLPSLFATSLLHCSTQNSSRSTDFAVLVTFRDASKGPLLHPTLATRWLEMPAFLRICRHTTYRIPHMFLSLGSKNLGRGLFKKKPLYNMKKQVKNMTPKDGWVLAKPNQPNSTNRTQNKTTPTKPSHLN